MKKVLVFVVFFSLIFAGCNFNSDSPTDTYDPELKITSVGISQQVSEKDGKEGAMLTFDWNVSKDYTSVYCLDETLNIQQTATESCSLYAEYSKEIVLKLTPSSGDHKGEPYIVRYTPEKKKTTTDPSLTVTSVNFSQRSFTYDCIERARVSIGWKINKDFTSLSFFGENITETPYEVPSNYDGLTVVFDFDRESFFELTPVNGNIRGKTYYVKYKADKSKSVAEEEESLPDGVLEIDCNKPESGSYIIQELNKSNVKFSNARNKTIFLARYNLDDYTLVSDRSFSVIENNRGLKLNRSISKDSAGKSNADGSEKLYYEIPPEETLGSLSRTYSSACYYRTGKDNGNRIIERVDSAFDFDPSKAIELNKGTASRSVTASASYPIDYNVGDTKTVYASLDEDTSLFSREKTAVCQYKSDICYVWVVQDYLCKDGETAVGKVTPSFCASLGKTLDEILPLERNIFGHESDSIYGSDFETMVPMETNSETGTKINILLYDIGGDYKEGDTKGVYGYFSSVDYLPKGTIYAGKESDNPKRSNCGKFLHVDSGLASNEVNRNYLYDVIVHESQHLLYTGQKGLRIKNREVLFMNEMFASLAEEIFQTKLNVSDFNSSKLRFKQLTVSWQHMPFFTWDTTTRNCMLSSYSNAYALGVLMAKKYGGADFVYDYMHMEGSSASAFVEAIKLYDENMTEDLMFRDLAAELCTGKIFNSTVYSTKHVMDGYNYPMTAFDYMNTDLTNEDGITSKGTQFTELSETKSFPKYKLDVSKLKDVTTDEIELEFTGKAEAGMKEYLIIVPKS